MSLIAPVKNGQVVDTSKNTSSKEAEKSGGTLGKDAFLQLLVAQMKYQDPLEPTSNTEYISQFATFSELEQMQNMSASMDLFRASSLVGQTVLLKVTDSEGRETTVQGNVDYVVYERNKAYLSVNGDLYSMDDLDTVADPTYLEAYRLGAEFLNILNKLPAIEHLTLADREKVEKLDKMYQDMNDYQKSFLTAEQVEKMNQYVKKMKDMVAVAEANKGDSDKDDAGKDDDGDEGGDK